MPKHASCAGGEPYYYCRSMAFRRKCFDFGRMQWIFTETQTQMHATFNKARLDIAAVARIVSKHIPNAVVVGVSNYDAAVISALSIAM